MLRFLRLSPAAILPTRGTAGSAGLDLYSTDRVLIPVADRRTIRTGWAVAVEPGCYGRIAPRSGLAVKHGIDVLAGVIDADYRGEIIVCLINHGRDPFRVEAGERIAQFILERCEVVRPVEVESLDDTARGVGGFGSTGVA